MENVWFNYMDVIKDARMKQPRFTVYGGVMFGFCRVSSCTVILLLLMSLSMGLAIGRGAGSPGQGVNRPLKFEIVVKKLIPRLC